VYSVKHAVKVDNNGKVMGWGDVKGQHDVSTHVRLIYASTLARLQEAAQMNNQM
jgi:hypothetical protein